MATVKFVGNDAEVNRFRPVDFSSVLKELDEQRVLALDTETNVVESILNRKLKVISAAWDYGEVIAVFEWDFLTEIQQKQLGEAIRTKKNIIHNVSFDYQVFKTVGVTLENVVCTYLGEQVLTTGISKDQGYHGLQAVYKRRFDLDISKAEQLTFGEGGPYTDKQVQYAAVDVIRGEKLYEQQRAEMKSDDRYMKHKGNKGLYKTWWWENEFAKVVGDMETNGIRLHKERWYAIEDAVRPIYERELQELNMLVLRDFKDVLIKNGWYSEQDRFVSNIWSSSSKKKLYLSEYFDCIEKTAKTELKKYLRDFDPNFPDELLKSLNGKKWNEHSYPTTTSSSDKYSIIKALIVRDKTNEEEVDKQLNQHILINDFDWIVEQGWLIPAGTITLNWGSYLQRLTIFQAIDPTIESTGKDILEDFLGAHEIIPHYLEWNQTDYQLKNFSKKFYDEFVQLDGKHRTRYRQILSTGRLSTSKPNILNIPRKNDVYRQAVIPDDGYDFINADFDGQELFITAMLSQEPIWLDAIAKGYDLHSRNADMIYGNTWKNAAEPDCAYFAVYAHPETGIEPEYKKCKCPKHQVMRDNSKALSFGLIYGISAFKLAFRLKIEVEEAEMLVNNFFERLPNIKKMMDNFGRFAITKGRITEPVFGRSRFYDKWKLAIPEEHGGIIRASYNMPIQSSGGALLKIALVLLRRWINHSNNQQNIQILMPYHDEISIQSKPAFTNVAKDKLAYFMQTAATLGGFKGLGASAASGTSWYDTH